MESSLRAIKYFLISSVSTCTFMLYCNDIVYDTITSKELSFLQKVNELKPHYLFGKQAKAVLINHQFNSDRDEIRTAYNSYLTEKNKKDSTIVEKDAADSKNTKDDKNPKI